MPPRLIRLDDAEPKPWRNGGGVRRDLLEGPGEGEECLWRVSVARIAADGPFSSYPDTVRWFAIIDGAGVRLVFPGEVKRITWNSGPLRFDGGEAPSCKLIEGPATALNLMLHGGAHGAITVANDAAPWRPEAAQCGLFTAVGGVCHDGEHNTELPGHALLWFDKAPRALSFIGGQRRGETLGWWLCASPAP